MALSASKLKDNNCELLEPKPCLPLDVIVVRLEIEDVCNVSDEFLFNICTKDMAANTEGCRKITDFFWLHWILCCHGSSSFSTNSSKVNW